VGVVAVNKKMKTWHLFFLAAVGFVGGAIWYGLANSAVYIIKT